MRHLLTIATALCGLAVVSVSVLSVMGLTSYWAIVLWVRLQS
jgi:hypothetical protein